MTGEEDSVRARTFKDQGYALDHTTNVFSVASFQELVDAHPLHADGEADVGDRKGRREGFEAGG